MEHFEAAIDRIIGGLEKKNRVFIFLSYCIFLLFSFSIYFSHILHILFVYFQYLFFSHTAYSFCLLSATKYVVCNSFSFSEK